MTTKQTLRQYPGTLLSEKFADSNLPKDDKSAVLFLDRNPAAFEVLLTFLRTGRLLLPSRCPVSREEIQAEFDYWRITPAMMPILDGKPRGRLADQFRQKTLQAMLREGTIYMDVFMRYLYQEVEIAALNGKTQLYLQFGAPPAGKKGKVINDANLHKWLSLRRGHITILKEKIANEGFNVTVETGLPEHDWIYIVVQWPFATDAVPGTFTFE